MERDAELTDVPSPDEDFDDRKESVEHSADPYVPYRQEEFFGPAPDRYEDLINP
jgi:hypothetical protein